MGFSQFALMHIILHILCIGLAFWVLQGIRIENSFNKGDVGRIRLVLIMLSVLLGTAMSNLSWTSLDTQEAALMFS
ncbi:DUF1146 family protein [Jeotgalicoccus sp. WY2]|uniref:DUF1146 family protein n=1 Tax=Jeotgalicoccus sp. WY2 TaxID=2708346 RepID=UPI001BD2073A|nr:DUF1146 family protein [Jeotgalicoccus sp. WY2]